VSLGELRLELEDRLVYANVSGDIDMSNAADLRAELSTTIPNDAIGLILDLTDIDYLDSAGIHLIHHLREDLRASGQRLQLVIPQSSIINATLRLAGLDWADNTAESVDAARQALRADERSV
jgi:anti-sigma B factor antagonist